MKKFPSTKLKAKDRDGKEHIFKGTLLSVLLDSAGVTLGKALRGENLVNYVLLTIHVDGNRLPKGEDP
jgi:hypothetical protein